MSERLLQKALDRVFEVYREPNPDPLEIVNAQRQLVVYEEVARLNRIPPRHRSRESAGIAIDSRKQSS